MRLSVIVVAYNSAEFLAECLESVAARLKDVEHEVCVVDNASTDGGAALVRDRFPEARLVAHERNLGFAAGINAGLRATTGRFVLWLNPDCELADHGTAELLRVFDAEPEVGILGPKVVHPDGTVQLSCRSFPSYRTAFFNRASLLTRLFPRNRHSARYLLTDFDRSRPREVDWVSGACLLHRREVSDAVGGIDERFFMYCEDVDFCLRARRAGWKVLYHPALTARHRVAGSSRRLPARMIREHHRSMWTYYAKHFPRNPWKDAAVGAAIAGRCGVHIAKERLSRAWTRAEPSESSRRSSGRPRLGSDEPTELRPLNSGIPDRRFKDTDTAAKNRLMTAHV